MATSRRNARTERGAAAPPAATGEGGTGGTGSQNAAQAGGRAASGPRQGTGTRARPAKLPPVRLAPREELAAAARVAPLLRAARLVACWAAAGQRSGTADGLTASAASAAMAELELTAAELDVAWRVAAGTGMVTVPAGQAVPGPRVDVLASRDAGDVLAVWEDALRVMLRAEDLDGMATALYTVGGPVKMDALFEAYIAAAGSRDRKERPSRPGEDLAAGLSSALETLADLGVVELGTTEVAPPAGGVTFFDGTAILGRGTLFTSNGVTTATLRTSSLTPGAHRITSPLYFPSSRRHSWDNSDIPLKRMSCVQALACLRECRLKPAPQSLPICHIVPIWTQRPHHQRPPRLARWRALQFHRPLGRRLVPLVAIQLAAELPA